jgi:hypothetical protein
MKKMKTLLFATKSCFEEKKLHNISYILKTFHEHNNQSISLSNIYIFVYYQAENSIKGKIMVRFSLFLTF